MEAAGDIDVLMLDKTGTITFGNRMANEFLPAPGVEDQQLAEAAQLASLSDETPEGAASWCWPKSNLESGAATWTRTTSPLFRSPLPPA